MKSIGCYIVEIDQAYNNTQEVGGVELVMNLDVDNATYVNRTGRIHALPANYSGEMELGMEVIFHHNIARTSIGYGGQKVNEFHLMDNLYRVPFDLLFLYKKDGEWKAHGEYCFVKPIENERIEKIGSIYIPDTAQEKHKALHGVMCIPNDNFEVKKGEEIIFKPNSEHAYQIEGELMYKMKTERILCRV